MSEQQSRPSAPVADTGGASISVRDVHKAYLVHGHEPLVALDDIALDIADGEFVALLGPSGCGKSTLLNIMAGIDDASTGTVRITTTGSDPVPADEATRGRQVSPGMRLGYVFQRDSVLPWLTAQQNVELGLLSMKLTGAEQNARATRWLATVGLAGFETSHPGQLSGGMRKRVALATAFAHDPAVFFMDEPFAAVDAQTRQRLQEQLLELWAEQKRTVVFVTHDIEEAILLADRIVVMTARPGRILTEHRVSIARPRSVEEIRFDPEFQNLAAEIWSELKEDDEVERSQ